jgi:hypothetical protein
LKDGEYMREFARSEHMREKCHYCGCKNKLYTDIIDKQTGKIAGHTLRCCACGRIVTFIDPNYYGITEKSNIPIIDFMNCKFIAGKQKCIFEQYCPHKNCGLYGSRPPHKTNPDTDKHTKCDCNCECCKNTGCEFQYLNKLHIKASNGPRFK